MDNGRYSDNIRHTFVEITRIILLDSPMYTSRVAKCHSDVFIQSRCSLMYLVMFKGFLQLLCCNTS